MFRSPNPKGTPNPPSIVSAIPSHLVTPLASIQSELASCSQITPATPPAIPSPQVKGVSVSSALTAPQNPVSLSLKGPLSPPTASSLSTQSFAVAAESPPVFLTSLDSRLMVVVFSFSFVSMQILISFLIFSVICWLFSSVLFSLH